jgi:hypothetical protein
MADCGANRGPRPERPPDHQSQQFLSADRCRIYFKRELPPDRWRLFLKTGHPNLPTPRFRLSGRQQARIEKLRPISLGLPLAAQTPFPAEPTEKSVDIFFAGKIEGSSLIRQRGVGELLALRERGIVVDIPDGALPQSEFYRRCARAALTWSPEGLGWDCFRHYEPPHADRSPDQSADHRAP